MNRLEALADAIGHMNGIGMPSSEAYQLRNPGLLHAYALNRLQQMDDNGIRRFELLQGGYASLLDDLKIKCSGRSRSKLTPQNSLADLLPLYGLKTKMATDKTVRFLRVALKDDNLDSGVRLEFFLESETGAKDAKPGS
jgi:hypothetical protein